MIQPTKAEQERIRYLDEWALLMIKVWAMRMDAAGVGVSYSAKGEMRQSTGALKRSLDYVVRKESGYNSEKIEHFFNTYGSYLERGNFSGRKNNSGQYAKQSSRSNPTRKAKPWLRAAYQEGKRLLRDKMLEYTGDDFVMSLHQILHNPK